MVKVALLGLLVRDFFGAGAGLGGSFSPQGRRRPSSASSTPSASTISSASSPSTPSKWDHRDGRPLRPRTLARGRLAALGCRALHTVNHAAFKGLSSGRRVDPDLLRTRHIEALRFLPPHAGDGGCSSARRLGPSPEASPPRSSPFRPSRRRRGRRGGAGILPRAGGSALTAGLALACFVRPGCASLGLARTERAGRTNHRGMLAGMFLLAAASLPGAGPRGNFTLARPIAAAGGAPSGSGAAWGGS